ncbi:MAG: hypothetical protein HYU85_06770 [Chloroflexi bacterium]|nr:hypothetical protein [Chloroflexota bacterium]
MGGREVTAADVVAFFRYFFTGYLGNNYPFLSDMKNLEKSIYVSPTDKWAVVMKFQPGLSGGNHVYGAQAHNQIAPPEVYQKYGTPITDWRLDVGSGPFILKDYVTASSVTYAKNPDYWMRDPFFPENQLPYVDAFKILIIPDRSTQMAALRTGQLATLNTVEAEDAESLMKTNPELKWQQTLGSVPVIHFRIDTKPFDDIKVRQALVLAINNQELADQYYGGKAALFSYPIGATSDFSDIYLPLEKMPTEPTLSGSRASVPELYGYHPDKARQLLAEAGYPNGFQTEVLTWSRDVDLLSVIKEYWAKIGVDLKLDLKDPTVYTSMSQRFTYSQMIISDTTLSWPIMSALRPGLVQNRSRIFDDPVIEPLYFEMSRRYYDTAKQKLAVTLPLAEVLPNLPEDIGRLKWPTYVNEQAWMAILPNPYIYTMWQPWLKQFQGELVSFHDTFAYANYAWIDQELKKAMGR